MKYIKSYKIVIPILLLSLFAVSCGSCMIYKIYKYADYNGKIGENLPDTFRVEFPMYIDLSDYFCIQATINRENDMDFIIDTKAVGLVKDADLEKLNATDWGTLPLSSENAYGQKQKISLYFFDSFEIQSLFFGKPLFKEVTPNNSIYDIMDKNVLGTNILFHLFWKFDVDEKKMVLFSKKDSTIIKIETEGYTKIENGLRHDKINLIFPTQMSNKFTLDLGYNGEIEIDKTIFDNLSQQFPYKKILTDHTKSNTPVCVFEGMDIQWNNIFISNCLVIYHPTVNMNLIGSKLMHRFNFILAYGDRIKHTPQQHLYIKPVSNFQNIEKMSYISDFGFRFKNKERESIISGIELGGLADTAGLKLEDKLLLIDNGAFDLNTNNGNNELITYLSNKANVAVQVERKGQIKDFLLTKN